MSGDVRKVNRNALLGEEDRKGDSVYVNPTTGKSSSKPSADSVGVPRTTWWRDCSVGEHSSRLFDNQQVRERIDLEVAEMATYFPDFKLEEAEGAASWVGKIGGIGELKLAYPATYPAQKFGVEALDQSEGFNTELKQTVWGYDDIRPAGAVIVTMRLFLQRKEA